MADHTESHITLHPHSNRVRILAGDTLIADTRNAIELRECIYPHCNYVPLDDLGMSRLNISSAAPYCPVKGDKTYLL